MVLLKIRIKVFILNMEDLHTDFLFLLNTKDSEKRYRKEKLAFLHRRKVRKNVTASIFISGLYYEQSI